MLLERFLKLPIAQQAINTLYRNEATLVTLAIVDRNARVDIVEMLVRYGARLSNDDVQCLAELRRQKSGIK